MLSKFVVCLSALDLGLKYNNLPSLFIYIYKSEVWELGKKIKEIKEK